ncbi:hypothetical protein PIIN_04498 [Serendipita indica DSM 11827]|uniref:Uncharacterized protein n=1 Tax=Serendipita indica (strain DSM 11827) TaxID=1109443 RepID=G4TGV9_SERID|nr:hypothetical protein PIIN_04498 [Serendipita indica DSM 11827]
MSTSSPSPSHVFSSRSSDFDSAPGTPPTPTTALPSDAGDALKDRSLEEAPEMDVEEDDIRKVTLEDQKEPEDDAVRPFCFLPRLLCLTKQFDRMQRRIYSC